MIFWHRFKLAFVSVFNNKVRSLVTMICIIVGMAITVAAILMSRGFARNIIDYLVETSNGLILLEYREKTDFGIDHSPMRIVDKTGTMYSFEQVEQVRTLPLVRDVITKNSEHDVLVSWLDQRISGQYLETLNINEQKIFNKNYQIVLGSMFSDSDFIDGTQSVLIHQDIAHKLFAEDDNPIGRDLIINDHVFLVRGVYKNKRPTWKLRASHADTIFIPFNTWIAYSGSEEIQTLGIVPLKVQYLEQTARTVEEKLNEDELAPGVYQVMNLAVLASEVENKIANARLISLLVAFLALLLGGLSLMDLMYISVMERQHEIAVSKAVGLSAQQVKQQFLLEAIVLAAVGGIFGFIIGFGAYIVGSKILGYDLIIYPDVLVMSWVLIMSLGLTFGIMPARRAAKVNATDALRHL